MFVHLPAFKKGRVRFFAEFGLFSSTFDRYEYTFIHFKNQVKI